MNQAWLKYLPSFIRSKIEGKYTLQQAIGNTGWMMGDQIVRKAAGLLVGVLVARYLGPQLYGEFSYAVAIVVIFSPIAMLALDDISLRELIRNPENREEILGTSFVLMVAGGFIAFSLALAATFVLRPEDSLVQWLVGIIAAGTIVQAFIAIEFWFESQMQWKFTVYARTSAFLLFSLVKIGLILVQAPLVAFAWAGLVESVFGSMGLLIVYLSKGFKINTWRFNKTMAGSLLSDSWPLLFSALLTMVYLRIDQIMLGNMVGNKALGNYSVAVQISEAWFFIPIAITSSVFPAVVDAEKISEDLFYTNLQKLFGLMVLLSYAVALPVTIFSKQIIQLLFSSVYADAGPLLAILIWTGIFTSLGAARNILIVAKNWARINLISNALGCALNILLNYLLIPRYEAMGAVIATFVSYWFAVHGTCLFLKPLRKTGWMITKAIFYPKAW